MRASLVSSLLAVLVPLAPLASAGVIVVDKAGGGDFTTLQAAVDASADGDTILVRPGDYSNPGTPLFVLLGAHSLVVARDGDGEVLLDATLVSSLPADDFVVLRGLTFAGGGITGLLGGNLSLGQCEGPVLVEDCRAEGIDGPLFYPGGSGNRGVHVYQTAAVVFQRCTFSGGDGSHADPGGFPFPLTVAFSGQTAVRVFASEVAFYDCTLVGGNGGSASGLPAVGGHGAPALHVLDASVTLSGCQLVGGAGGNGCTVEQLGEGCRGGDGVKLETTGGAVGPVQVRDLDTGLLPGAGGALEDEAGTAPAGEPVNAPPGTHHAPQSGQAVSLVKAGPLRTGELGTLTIEGPPGALFGLFAGFQPGFLPLDHFKGVFVPGFPVQGPLLLAFIPPSGQLVANYGTPDIGAFGLDALLLVDQLLVDQGADGVILSAPTTHVQVGPEF